MSKIIKFETTKSATVVIPISGIVRMISEMTLDSDKRFITMVNSQGGLSSFTVYNSEAERILSEFERAING